MGAVGHEEQRMLLPLHVDAVRKRAAIWVPAIRPPSSVVAMTAVADPDSTGYTLHLRFVSSVIAASTFAESACPTPASRRSESTAPG